MQLFGALFSCSFLITSCKRVEKFLDRCGAAVKNDASTELSNRTTKFAAMSKDDMTEEDKTAPKSSNFMLWLTITFVMWLMWWFVNR
jgi:hypothetical protein